MTEPPGRRERKKAATRQKIADTALRLFLEHGYDAVGIRDVAAESDVAVTTVFSHFASKEALVFERDQDFEQRLTRAVTDRPPHQPLIPALHREVQALVRHCTAEDSAPVRRMIEASPALQKYEESMSLRHAQALATALATDPHLTRSTTACQATARFTIDAYTLARQADDPQATTDEIFRMIKAAWEATTP
ncbi:TetR/AcrR family transcriptional regulator [Streptomyces platensis]|uniref:TetR/AcrR family transcriptional regulator n=1 Tax=Streptomyces platensis TaxID=58346 RepID=UPI001F34496A|nr:TetR/AcrR family transcriptional regulator [Streptomyces platensis]MCF3146872.1 TetR/AcrR family transcriptional regulator [Streptomyces platensis]